MRLMLDEADTANVENLLAEIASLAASVISCALDYESPDKYASDRMVPATPASPSSR